MKRRLAAAVIAASALGVLAAAPASAAQLCVNADVNVNGTAQTVSQCLPQ